MMSDCSREELINNRFLPVIAVLARNLQNGIGINGTIPWNCSLDMKIFKAITTNSIMIMGRKTLESLPKVLDSENRSSICLTKREGKDLEALQAKYPTVMFTNKTTIADIEEEAKKFFNISFNTKLCFTVIGGTKTIRTLEDDISALFLSTIDDTSLCDTRFEDGDYIYDRVAMISTPAYNNSTNYGKMTVYVKQGICTYEFRDTMNNRIIEHRINEVKRILDNHQPKI